MNDRNKVVDQTIFLVRNQTMSQQLFSRQQNLLIVIIVALTSLLHCAFLHSALLYGCFDF